MTMEYLIVYEGECTAYITGDNFRAAADFAKKLEGLK